MLTNILGVFLPLFGKIISISAEIRYTPIIPIYMQM